MGCCVSRCLPESDMATELEAELDENPHGSSLLASNMLKDSSSAGSALLTAGEVVCLHAVGQGASGVVYKGSYRGSVVAVKRVLLAAIPDKASARKSVESSLEIEAIRMGSLRHPNIVLFMGACLHDKHFCIVSEYCTRGSLYDVLHIRRKGATKRSTSGAQRSNRPDSRERTYIMSDSDDRGKLSLHWNLRLRLALGAARGLLYLHSADPPLVHSELKSTNILVDDSWNTKLADFGTRRVAEALGGQKRSSGENGAQFGLEVNLIRWTAPEIISMGPDRVVHVLSVANNRYPQAVDIYSFGMVMWELTTGVVPFLQFKTNEEISEAVLRGQRPPIPSGLCRPKWADLMTRCMAHSPHDRPSAAEVVSILEEFSKSDGMDNALIGVRGTRQPNKVSHSSSSQSMSQSSSQSASRSGGRSNRSTSQNPHNATYIKQRNVHI